MNKPQGFDESVAFTGEFESIAPGGKICVIKSAVVQQTTTGKETLVILFDIADGESKGFYQRKFDEAKKSNADAKWQGVYRQLTEGNSLPFFKGLITAIENSNSGFKWDFDESKLKGKLFGGIFGQEEYEKNGEVKLATKCMQIRSVDVIKKGVEAPAIKKLANAPYTFSGSIGTAPAEYSDELPF